VPTAELNYCGFGSGAQVISQQ